jgi:hypothetical protein
MKNTYTLSAAAICLAVAGLAGAADQVPTDIMMPGTQPNEVGNFESPDKCDNCHGGYDEARVWSNEPAFGWRGGAMGNAGRDPIFWATLAIAEQDFDGAGDLCIRCHSSRGWYGGRSVPTDGSGLALSDDNGIDCDTCHTLTNPDMSEHQGTIGPGFEPHDPVTGEGYYGSGMLSLWGGSEKLGPYGDAEARHQFMQSNFHRGDICGSCHDVSNPAVGDLAPGNGAQPGNALAEGTFNGIPNLLDLNQNAATKAAFNNPPYAYGIVERTFSEYKSGLIDDTLVTDFPTLPADLRVSGGALAFAYNAAMQAGGTYEDGSPRYFNCQGCHMRPDTGEGCNKAGVPTRSDLPKHDQSGGNYWMWPLIQYQDQQGTLRLGGGLTQTQIEAMDAGRQRAEQQLQMAANLEVVGNSVKITNLTGHKLISGYPEGRRMWLNVRWYCAGVPCGEDGAYGPLGVTFTNPRNPAQTFVPESIIDLDNPDLKIYDAHYAIHRFRLYRPGLRPVYRRSRTDDRGSRRRESRKLPGDLPLRPEQLRLQGQPDPALRLRRHRGREEKRIARSRRTVRGQWERHDLHLLGRVHDRVAESPGDRRRGRSDAFLSGDQLGVHSVPVDGQQGHRPGRWRKCLPGRGRRQHAGRLDQRRPGGAHGSSLHHG